MDAQMDVQNGCTKWMLQIRMLPQDVDPCHERLMLFASVDALKMKSSDFWKVITDHCQGFFHKLFYVKIFGTVSVFYQSPPQRDLKANSIFHVCTI